MVVLDNLGLYLWLDFLKVVKKQVTLVLNYKLSVCRHLEIWTSGHDCDRCRRSFYKKQTLNFASVLSSNCRIFFLFIIFCFWSLFWWWINPPPKLKRQENSIRGQQRNLYSIKYINIFDWIQKVSKTIEKLWSSTLKPLNYKAIPELGKLNRARWRSPFSKKQKLKFAYRFTWICSVCFCFVLLGVCIFFWLVFVIEEQDLYFQEHSIRV